MFVWERIIQKGVVRPEWSVKMEQKTILRCCGVEALALLFCSFC